MPATAWQWPLSGSPLNWQLQPYVQVQLTSSRPLISHGVMALPRGLRLDYCTTITAADLRRSTVPNTPASGREDSLAVNRAVSLSARSTVLEHLRTLRGSLARARDTLMHFKDDRADRDTLEPAARRGDQLMN